MEHTNEDGSKSEIIPINLNGNSIAKVGDAKDLLKVYRNGNVEIEKKIGKVVLDGSESWYLYSESTNTIGFRVALSGINSNIKVTTLTNYFIGYITIQIYNTDIEGCWLHENHLYIKINKSIVQNLEELKTWLSTHNTEVRYQLATPETIKLPSIDPIELWEGTNKFELITNLDTTFEMEYVINKNNILDEIQTAMLDA